MHTLFAATSIFNIGGFLHSAGPWALVLIALIIFIENGLLFPFLPGDSLVFTAALVVVALGIPLWVLIVVAAVAAILGDIVGYAIGTRLGRRLFKPDARLFKTRYRDEADAFLQRYGAFALVLARFVPVVRTFLPPVVGTSSIPYRKFLLWNIIGGTAWAVVLCVAGFYLGRISFVANNIEVIAVLLAVVSVLPIVIAALARRRRKVSAPETEPVR